MLCTILPKPKSVSSVTSAIPVQCSVNGSSSIDNCDDHLHLHSLIRSSNICFFTYSHSSVDINVGQSDIFFSVGLRYAPCDQHHSFTTLNRNCHLRVYANRYVTNCHFKKRFVVNKPWFMLLHIGDYLFDLNS